MEYMHAMETTVGDVVVDLDVDGSPELCRNVLKLSMARYYTSSLVYNVQPSRFCQVGDPRGDGWGGPGYTIRCEYNPLRYEAGVMGMALAGKDTGGSQFFVTLSPQPHLNGRYTIFGRVSQGMNVVDFVIAIRANHQYMRQAGIRQ